MEVAEAAGLAYQQLHRWTAAGAVRPSIANAGQGHRRIWSDLDRQVLTHIAQVGEDLATLELPTSIELVCRIWDACHDDPTADITEIAEGTVSITIDRRTDTGPSTVRRGLEVR